jgi:hypothetical protein
VACSKVNFTSTWKPYSQRERGEREREPGVDRRIILKYMLQKDDVRV